MAEHLDLSGCVLPQGQHRESTAPEATTVLGGSSASARTSAPGSAVEALAAVRAGLRYLAEIDVTDLTVAEQADCLRGLAAADSARLAASSRVLSGFTARMGYAEDGQAGPKAWLCWQARVTAQAAGAALAWVRRLEARPKIAAGLAAGWLSASWARRLCDWIDDLPAGARGEAESILVDAAADGLALDDLAALAEEIRARTAEPDTDGDDDRFGQRRVQLIRHFRGHARLDGDLTPEAAEAVRAMLDALGKRAGPEDVRTRAQRDHDALEEGCRRLIAGGDLPQRAGQPVHIELQMTLDQLLGQADSDHAAAAAMAASGSQAPPGADCDATLIPVVTGAINHDMLDALARRLLRPEHNTADGRSWGTAPADTAPADTESESTGTSLGDMAAGDTALGDTALGDTGLGDTGLGRTSLGGTAAGDTRPDRGLRAARQLTVAEALRLLSGPTGLAARLRAGRLAGPAASISLPLDVGRPTSTIPPQLRIAVTRRDQRCRFPGCQQLPAVCHVHHLRPRADGGPTSLSNCCLLCPFHHLIVIHRWGWTLILNPDGTTTAISPDGGKALQSHPRPVEAA